MIDINLSERFLKKKKLSRDRKNTQEMNKISRANAVADKSLLSNCLCLNCDAYYITAILLSHRRNELCERDMLIS